MDFVCMGKGYVIARGKKAWLNWRVYGDSGNYVGKIVNVFGPAKNPYIKISIERKYDGGKLYLKKGGGNAKRKR